MKKLIVRLLTGLCFAIPMMLMSMAFTQASPLPLEGPVDVDQCRACHSSSVEAWENSTHGHAYDDEAFVTIWQEQGEPTECLTCHTTGYDPETNTWQADNITCVACHYEGIENHPMQPMGVDRSSELCGECHTDTYFQLSTSVHGETGLTCVNCHTPHSNSLKYETTPDLCASCHGNRVSRFNHSSHHDQGLSCTTCHLDTDQLTEDGHQKSNHTFMVNLDTCTTCHAYEIHGPANISPESGETVGEEGQTADTVDALHAVEATVVSTDPQPGNPLGFAVVAGLVGMAGGMILSPWLERWYRKQNSKDEE